KPADVANLDYGIVYARVPRDKRIESVDDGRFAGYDVPMAMFDRLPEVGHILSGFTARGQLVWRHKDDDGHMIETVIFDCFNGMPELGVYKPQQTGDDTCVPMDPAVSYDGGKVAFSVYHGTFNDHRNINSSSLNGSGILYTPTWAQ